MNKLTLSLKLTLNKKMKFFINDFFFFMHCKYLEVKICERSSLQMQLRSISFAVRNLKVTAKPDIPHLIFLLCR